MVGGLLIGGSNSKKNLLKREEENNNISMRELLGWCSVIFILVAGRRQSEEVVDVETQRFKYQISFGY